jgi:hypothetical protein
MDALPTRRQAEMSIVRVFVYVLLGLALLFTRAAAGEGPDGYELIAEIRMSEPNEWEDARTLFRSAAVKDGFVYVISQADILHVFDCRNLAQEGDVVHLDQPVLEIVLDRGNHNGLLRVGDRLLCYGWSGAQMFDIREASSPARVGAFPDSDEHILNLAHHETHLVAACHERVLVYSLGMMPDYPMRVASLTMEFGLSATAVAVVDRTLCVSGIRTRSDGTDSCWLGTWDFARPECPTLIGISETASGRGHMVAQDGLLLAISSDQAELWQVDGPKPLSLDSAQVCGRAMAQDGKFIVLGGAALVVVDGAIELQCQFDCLEDRCYTGFPYLGGATEDFVVLPRPRSVLVLQRRASD